MTYEDRLVAEQMVMLEGPITAFLNSYGQHRNSPNQRTVIFFPGSTGSELVRANRRFDDENSVVYNTVWVDLFDIYFNQGALVLQMSANEDSGRQLILANGPLQNCAVNPYDDFVAWCGDNQLDLLMVAWDFRRSADWNLNFILRTLIPEVQRRAAGQGWRDPFIGATIIGHSAGGMLAKWILNEQDDPFSQNLRLVISVGTPFYGDTGQSEMLFTGHPSLGPNYNLDQITKVISTLPGGYYLFLLDSQTYDEYGWDLFQDPDCPLDRYPSFDAGDRTIRVDPYEFQDPQDANQGRYPIKYPQDRGNDWIWFESYLKRGLDDYRRIALPLPAAASAKLHSIRGVQITAGGADERRTKIMQQWAWYDFNQPNRQGVIQTFGGPGDGVVPAWSARLVTQPAATHVHTIRGQIDDGVDQMEHMVLMDHSRVRAKLLELMGLPGPGAQAMPVKKFSPASVEQLQDEQKRIEALVKAGPPDEARARVEAYVRSMDPERREALMRRWYIELPKGKPPTHGEPPPPLPDSVPPKHEGDPGRADPLGLWIRIRVAFARWRRRPLPPGSVPPHVSRLWRGRLPR